ncbi:pyrroline-5-carboxylate reductase ProI [Bacillus marinisedimentorum]|uniref:pyrroline-5-carboxylate reductase ProI n=1 Tax=Bacillus marinisedimentorum TaxID=1821260 RepID=UPI0007E0D698|nr:pyrroline-5-carboxylate reductase ProI [Bacillus marinisedimentorum]
MEVKKVSVLGAGSMAEALISGFLAKDLYEPQQLMAANRSNSDRLSELTRLYGIQTTHDRETLMKDADILILAVKPKDTASALETIKPYIKPHQLVISVLAGVHTETIADLLGKAVPVVRAMPNTSAAIGMSATAIAPGEHAEIRHVLTAEKLFESVGLVSIVSEHDMDAVTGLSGSGPAYVYYLVEAMEKAAEKIGLEQKVGKDLILQTIIGAAEMLKTSPKHPSQLRKEVTSPGGTTQAGLEVLEAQKYQEAMIECIKAAANRATVMGEEYKKALNNTK